MSRTVTVFPLFALLLFLSACGTEPQGAAGASGAGEFPQMPVSVSVPLSRTITQWDEYTGRFEAVEAVDIRARVNGYLESIHFEDGQLVGEGDLLFVIDPRPFEAAREVKAANVARAEARLKYTTTEVTRAEPLLSGGNISRDAYDLRIQERNQARAELAAAEAELKQAELDVEFTRVKAPVAGRISNHFVSIGNLVEGGSSGATVLTRIVSLDPIHFVFDASESDYLKYARLHETGKRPSSRGRPNPVQVKLSDEDTFLHEGVMNFVDNRVDPNTGTMRGRAIFENKDRFLTPGVFGRLRLKGEGPYEALLIPDTAIVADQSRRLVMIVGPEGVVTPKPVEIGPLHGGLRVVKAGLTAQDKVILDGLMVARPGSKVIPQETTIDLREE